MAGGVNGGMYPSETAPVQAADECSDLAARLQVVVEGGEGVFIGICFDR